MANHFKRCHFVPFGSNVSKHWANDFLLARPIAYSITTTGTHATMNSKYSSTKAAPPYSPVM